MSPIAAGFVPSFERDADGTSFAAAERADRRAVMRVGWRRHPTLMLRGRLRRPRPPVTRRTLTMSRAELLERLRALPVGYWSYAWEPAEVRHLGPMAQDFRETFGLGTSSEMIDMVDANGVLMAAMQALADQVEQLQQQVAALEADRDGYRG